MPIPVITVAQMREWEQATWASGQTEAEVIRRVGKVLAQRVRQLTKPGSLILILAGKGHNGDDARAAREHLSDRQVELLDVASPQSDLPKLTAALARRPKLVVDALFGIGLNRPLDELWVKFITCVNQARLPVLAVDAPSGLNAETGETFGAAIESFVTLTVGAPKQGLLQQGAWPFVGRLEVVNQVGLAPCPVQGGLKWTLPEDFVGFPPARPVAGHKGIFGHLGILAGSVGYHGAAVLAARGAQRAQPGLITLFTHQPAYQAIAPQLQAVMVKPWELTVELPDDFSTLLIGPGLAAADLPAEIKTLTGKMWCGLLQPVIVDASALDWLPLEPVPKNAIRVLTPHPGEAARLLQTTPQIVQADRLRAVREVSKRFGNSWVVLKGHQTLIGRSTGEMFVNSSGNPYLAQGGSGDALAGFIAGLLAQPKLQADVGQTLRYAVWQHGAAADALQSQWVNWTVEDLFQEIGRARPCDAGMGS